MKGIVILYTLVLSLAFLLPGIAIAQSSPPQGAIAQSSPPQAPITQPEPDSACYLRQPDGSVVDLSTLCVKTPTTGISPGASFVSNFQSLANSYPPQVRQELNQYSEKHTDSAIASAKTTCRVLRYGGTQAALTRRRALASYNPSSSEVAKQQITESLAINQYCPEFANR